MAALVVMPLPPLWQQNESYPADHDRTLLNAVLYQGVTKNTSMKVTQRATGGANMSVDVSGGACVIDGDNPAGTRAYLCTADTVTNLDLTAAPASNSRIDLIIARVRDDAVDGGGFSDWVLERKTGVVAASPVSPTVPPSSLELARVVVAANQVTIPNGSIIDRRASALPFTVATSTTRPVIVRTGHLVGEGDTGDLRIGRDGAWRSIDMGVTQVKNVSGSIWGGTPPVENVTAWDMIAGRATIPFFGGAGFIDLPYTFPNGIVTASFLPTANTQGIVVTYRTAGVNSTPRGDFIPLAAWSTETGAFGGSLDCMYQVFGW